MHIPFHGTERRQDGRGGHERAVATSGAECEQCRESGGTMQSARRDMLDLDGAGRQGGCRSAKRGHDGRGWGAGVVTSE